MTSTTPPGSRKCMPRKAAPQDVLRIADALLANPDANAQAISFAAQVYQQLPDYARLEKALEKWTKVDAHAGSVARLRGLPGRAEQTHGSRGLLAARPSR